MDGVTVNTGLTIPASELEMRFSRAGGPGGQNVNRRETRVEVVFDVERSPSLGPRQRARLLERLASRLDDGRLRVVASEHRTQAENRRAALDRLEQTLRQALKPPPPPRRATRPSRRSVERRLTDKRRRSERKRDRTWRQED